MALSNVTGCCQYSDCSLNHENKHEDILVEYILSDNDMKIIG